MQLAVVEIGRAVSLWVNAHRDTGCRQQPRAVLDLLPLFSVARDLVGSVPAQVAVDAVFLDQRPCERLRSLREAPDPQRIRLAVAT
jgi:hypothetical protein